MGVILCGLAVVSLFLTIRRSLGDGLGLLLLVGCVYGIVRCNVFDGYTHFLFDAAVLGSYAGIAPRLVKSETLAGSTLWGWVLGLACVPGVLILLSPFLDAQPLLIQLLGLRAAIYFVPLCLVGATLDAKELERLAQWAVFVTLLVSGFALAEFVWGVERFYPVNEVSELIYRSNDVGEMGALRLPATFISSHAYGGTMVGLIPLLVFLVERGRWKVLAFLALGLCALGAFASAARSPVLGLLVVSASLALRGFRNPASRAVIVAAGAVLLVIVPRVERLQRFETLSDLDYTTGRVVGSVNVGFFETIAAYPLGRGLASAVGTSIPYFLADQARPQVGMENEYARIAVEQGLLGLAVWVAFTFYVLGQNPLRLKRFGDATGVAIWAVCAFGWTQALIGTGLLTSIPGTAILMLYMGITGVQRPRAHESERAMVGLSVRASTAKKPA
jgi:hypothetical protein